MHVGRKIQYLRSKNGIYISRVADYLKISDKEYMDIENGTYVPNDEILEKIASLYGVDVTSLKNDNKIVLFSHGNKIKELEAKKERIRLRSYTRRWIKFWLIISQIVVVGSIYGLLEPIYGNPQALGALFYLIISIPLSVAAFNVLNHAKSRNELVATGILSLIFVSFIGGVMMLTVSDDKFIEN